MKILYLYYISIIVHLIEILMLYRFTHKFTDILFN